MRAHDNQRGDAVIEMVSPSAEWHYSSTPKGVGDRQEFMKSNERGDAVIFYEDESLGVTAVANGETLGIFPTTLDAEDAINAYWAERPAGQPFTADVEGAVIGTFDTLDEAKAAIDAYRGERRGGARYRPRTKVPKGELGQLRARAKEIGAEEAAKVRDGIDQMTGGARLAIPGRGQTGGEWDWYRSGQIDKGTKSRLRREGWLTEAGAGE